ncbi:MAG: hypothetical protein KIPDCIKN_01275 [Haliscomenobacter sp.]|jgi:hypothetical protein|nr:hypothetical protein [Haliscomenobacter sp.]
MDSLKELIRFVDRNKVKSIEVLGYQKEGRKTLVHQLYQKIASGELDTDEEAADMFFRVSPSDILYRKLKTKLKSRLINTVFFLDLKQPKYSESDRAYLTCWKEWSATQILFKNGVAKVAVELAHRILKQSQAFEFSDISLNIARMLRAAYATRFPNAKKYEQFNELVNFYAGVQAAELKAEEYYFDIVNHYAESQATQPEVSAKCEKYVQELEPMVQSFQSHRLLRFFYQIKVASYMCRNDYRTTIGVCNEALSALQAKTFYPQSHNAFFYFQKIVCHAQLKEFEEGKRLAEAYLIYDEQGSFNWFKNRQLAVFFSFHSGDYEEALRVFEQASSDPGFRRLDPVNAETWKISEAYLLYLLYTGRIPSSSEKAFNFRIAKFLNEVPIYSKDKKGMNIPILIVQILFTIAQQRYDLAVLRIDSIEKYCTRYLRKDDTYRSSLFIKMLLCIPQAGFHRVAVSRRAAKYWELLRKHPLEYANQGHQIEVIPYEALWEMALDSLGTRIHAPSRALPKAGEP